MIVTSQVPSEFIAAVAVGLVGVLCDLGVEVSMLYVRLQKRIPKKQHFIDQNSCKRFRQNPMALEAMRSEFRAFREV
jgi:hypothetical protein